MSLLFNYSLNGNEGLIKLGGIMFGLIIAMIAFLFLFVVLAILFGIFEMLPKIGKFIYVAFLCKFAIEFIVKGLRGSEKKSN